SRLLVGFVVVVGHVVHPPRWAPDVGLYLEQLLLCNSGRIRGSSLRVASAGGHTSSSSCSVTRVASAARVSVWRPPVVIPRAAPALCAGACGRSQRRTRG